MARFLDQFHCSLHFYSLIIIHVSRHRRFACSAQPRAFYAARFKSSARYGSLSAHAAEVHILTSFRFPYASGVCGSGASRFSFILCLAPYSARLIIAVYVINLFLPRLTTSSNELLFNAVAPVNYSANFLPTTAPAIYIIHQASKTGNLPVFELFGELTFRHENGIHSHTLQRLLPRIYFRGCRQSFHALRGHMNTFCMITHLWCGRTAVHIANTT